MWNIDHTTISSVVEDVVVCVKPDAVYLFGSQAKGSVNASSDIDLMVVVKDIQTLGRYVLTNKLRQATRKHRVPIDILVYSPEEVATWKDHRIHIIHTIMRDGIKLYERSPEDHCSLHKVYNIRLT